MKDEYSFKNAKRGAVIPAPPGTVTLTRISLDEDVVNWFREQVMKASGGDFRQLINQALREHVARERDSQQQVAGERDVEERTSPKQVSNETWDAIVSLVVKEAVKQGNYEELLRMSHENQQPTPKWGGK